MPTKIANYVNICSNALLSIVDNEYVELKDANGVYTIEVNKQLKDLLYFDIKNICKGYYQFGNNNIIINTCIPVDNWRFATCDNPNNISKNRYTLTNAEDFIIDTEKLQIVLDSIWKLLQKDLYKFIFISHPNLDTFDLSFVINKTLPDNISSYPTNYYFLMDPNHDFLHDDDVPRWIVTDIEIELRKRKLIL